MTVTAPLWIEIVVSVLLLASGLACVVGAIGILRMKHFIQRMHPATLAFTAGSWGAGLGSVVYFSAVQEKLALHAWLIIILLSITAPVTTVFLARAGLFRARQAGRDPAA